MPCARPHPPAVVVTSALAVIERVIPPEILIANMDYRLPGERTWTRRSLCEG